MSVFLSPKIQTFRATVDIGPSLASIVSSWEKKAGLTYKDYRAGTQVCCIARIANFVQEYEGRDCRAVLDWIVLKDTTGLQYIMELKLIHTIEIDPNKLNISETIQTMINKNLFVLRLQQLFQQAHPGDLSAVGISGSTGKEGDNQSD